MANQSKRVFSNLKPYLLPSVYVIGGIISVLWLFVTPEGLMGKADAIGYAVCHRIDTRSFHIGLRQLPLCARCTGQYIGAVLGMSFLWIFGKRQTGSPPKRVIAGFAILSFLFILDGLNSYLYLPPFLQLFPKMPHLYQPSNVLRLFTGTGIGLVIAMVLYPVFWGTVLEKPDPRPAVGDLKIVFILLGLGALVDLLILTGSKYILYPAALLSAGGVLLLLGMVYTILWIYFYKKENQFTKLTQITGYLCAGLLIAIIQIAFIDFFRYIITGTWSGLFFD